MTTYETPRVLSPSHGESPAIHRLLVMEPVGLLLVRPVDAVHSTGDREAARQKDLSSADTRIGGLLDDLLTWRETPSSSLCLSRMF